MHDYSRTDRAWSQTAVLLGSTVKNLNPWYTCGGPLGGFGSNVALSENMVMMGVPIYTSSRAGNRNHVDPSHLYSFPPFPLTFVCNLIRICFPFGEKGLLLFLHSVLLCFFASVL